MHQNYHTEFLTATVYNWMHLLATDNFKNILLDSFQWLVKNKKCSINAFCSDAKSYPSALENFRWI